MTTLLRNKAGNIFATTDKKAEYLLDNVPGYRLPDDEEREEWCQKHNPKLSIAKPKGRAKAAPKASPKASD